MTFTVTIKARAVPVTVKSSDDAEPLTVDPWQERSLHLDDSATLSITETEPAADESPEQSSDEIVAAAQATRDAEEATEEQPRRGRKPSVD